MISDFVEVVHCATAKDFLEALAPTSEYFHDHYPNNWLFRGHTLALGFSGMFGCIIKPLFIKKIR